MHYGMHLLYRPPHLPALETSLPHPLVRVPGATVVFHSMGGLEEITVER